MNVLEAGMTIHSELVSAKQAKLPEDFMAAVFDANLLTENLLVRNFRNGDRRIYDYIRRPSTGHGHGA